jgi:Arc/MetJ-type ribon-helix-helix transcriptional regulator
MKVSISLPSEDIQFLDGYAIREGYDSRSAVVQKAVRLLRASQLGPAYEDAFLEWEQDSDAGDWDLTAGDGLAADAPG